MIVVPSFALWNAARVDSTLLVANCINDSYVAIMDHLLEPMQDGTLSKLYRAKSREFFSTQVHKGVSLCESLQATANHIYRDLRWAHQTRASLHAYKAKLDAVEKTTIKSLNPWDESIEPSIEHIHQLLKDNYIRTECGKEIEKGGFTPHKLAEEMTRIKHCLREKRKDAVRAYVVFPSEPILK
jgi:hypothetical protein